MKSLAKLKTSIDQLVKDVNSIRGRTQTILVHSAAHVLLDGEVGPLNRTFTVAKRGLAKKNMQVFNEAYAFVKLTKDGKFIVNKKARRDYAASIGKTIPDLTAADCDAYIKTIDANWWEDPTKEATTQKALIIADTINRVAQGIYDAIESGRDITHECDPVAQAQANLVQAIKLATAASPTEQDGAQYKPHPIVGNKQVPVDTLENPDSGLAHHKAQVALAMAAE